MPACASVREYTRPVPCERLGQFPDSPPSHVMAILHQRRDWKAALTSSLKTSGSSQAAKCLPSSTSLK